MHKFGKEVAGCEPKHKRKKKTPWKPKKNGQVMPWKHIHNNPLPSINKNCWRKKPSGFWSFNSPQVPGAFGKIPCFFSSRVFAQWVFCFKQKPMATKKTWPRSAAVAFFIVKFTVDVFLLMSYAFLLFVKKAGL